MRSANWRKMLGDLPDKGAYPLRAGRTTRVVTIAAHDFTREHRSERPVHLTQAQKSFTGFDVLVNPLLR
jgi:hypothetical protein